MPERLNWKQACEILGCTKSTLYRLVKEEKLPAYGVGKRGRWYLRADCEKLLAGQAIFLDSYPLKS